MDHAIYEVDIPLPWQNKTILDINVRKKHNVNILGLKIDGKLMLSITPDTVLKKGMTMLILGTKKDIQKCLKY